jgi:hypothetical protein
MGILEGWLLQERHNVRKSLAEIPLGCFRMWEASMLLWEQVYRGGATIADAAGWVQQQKTHRTITHMMAVQSYPPIDGLAKP